MKIYSGIGSDKEPDPRFVDDDIIIYCFKGARAANTYIALRLAGFNNVHYYYGSWNEWSRDPALPINAEVLVA